MIHLMPVSHDDVQVGAAIVPVVPATQETEGGAAGQFGQHSEISYKKNFISHKHQSSILDQIWQK